MATLKKLSTNLWFDKQAEDAAKFYTTVFKNASIGRTTHYGKEGFEIHRMPEGTVMTIEFELEGQSFVGLNGGPHFKFSEAISFIINCENQDEIDFYWNQLGEGGDERAQQCGWLKDKFGLSWQVVPIALADMMGSGTKEQSERVMGAMLQMKKLDLGELKKAFEGDNAVHP